MLVRLLHGGTRALIVETRTNADGRCDSPLLEGDAFQPGPYILAFETAPYFRSRNTALSNPPFLDTVEIAFHISTPTHHHVPLLISPWSYSTYKGS